MEMKCFLKKKCKVPMFLGPNRYNVLFSNLSTSVTIWGPATRCHIQKSRFSFFVVYLLFQIRDHMILFWDDS